MQVLLYFLSFIILFYNSGLEDSIVVNFYPMVASYEWNSVPKFEGCSLSPSEGFPSGKDPCDYLV
jgi:hypothetical protein